MSATQTQSRFHPLTRAMALVVTVVFSAQFIVPPASVYGQAVALPELLGLPAPGAMVRLTPGYVPALIKGITIHPENPLQFDFIIDNGDSKLEAEEFNQEARKLIKYFLTSLTVPSDDLWVNLSPQEKDRIIPDKFGETEMGRDLLIQDYLLKQLTASLMYPQEELGRNFWQRVYAKAKKLYGATEIPMNTFNNIWIIPEKATVYEYKGSAYVVGSRLKVMLEEDYAALAAGKADAKFGMRSVKDDDAKAASKVTSDVVREVLIPEIEREVNEGKTFANLRQIYDAMILATWYKDALKESLLGKVYANQNKIMGVDVEDKAVKQRIYEQYLAAFKKGVYNYIKEDVDADTGRKVPRKYFSGGALMGSALAKMVPANVKKAEGPAASPLTEPEKERLDNTGSVQNFTTNLVENLAKAPVTAEPASRPNSSPLGRWEHWANTSVEATELNIDMFRDYDFRNVGPTLKPEMVFRLGLVWADMALAKAEKAGIQDRRVLLARDGRKIEPELVDALVAALRYRGLDVIYIADEGPNSVTSYSWAVQQFKPLMSIFITASHLSKPENIKVRGFKVAMVNEKGGAVQSMTTQEIKSASLEAMKTLLAKPELIKAKEADRKGTFTPEDITENVIRFNALVGKIAAAGGSLYELGEALRSAGNALDVLEQFERKYAALTEPLKGMKIVVEGSHTQSGILSAETYRRLGAKVVLLHGDIQEVSGLHKADPSVTATLADLEAAIIEYGADFGMAFDLDGDRGALRVPVRWRTKPEVTFVDLAPDNVIVSLLPVLRSRWGYKDVKAGVIRDVLGTYGVNDVSETSDTEFFQTDAGYVFLKKIKAEKEKDGYVFPIYGERSGHTWLHVSGEIENPLAVSLLFAALVKDRQQEFFQNRIAGVEKEDETLNPAYEVYNKTTVPYAQSPRFQPFYHPDFLAALSAYPGNTTGWKYDPQNPTNPPQAVVALGRDIGIKRLQAEFTPGKTYNTPAGQLTVQEVKTYQDTPQEGGLFRFADIFFALNGKFAGRFVFRASSNDPSFVASYEAPIIDARVVEENQRLRQAVAGPVLDFLVSERIAIVTMEEMLEAMPHLTNEQRTEAFNKANLPFVEDDFDRFLIAQGRPGVLSSPAVLDKDAFSPESDLEEGRIISSPVTLEGHLNEFARFLSEKAGATMTAEDSRQKVITSMAESANKRKVLDDFAESVGISPAQALKNMIEAGIAVQAEGQKEGEYNFTPDFYKTENLERFREIQIKTSSNPDMVDLALVRLERILLSAIDVDLFINMTIPKERQEDAISILTEQNVFPTLTAFWRMNRALEREDVAPQGLLADDLITPGSVDYYRKTGVVVDISVPTNVSVDQEKLNAVLNYQETVRRDMERGGFNYRGAGSKQTVLDWFLNNFVGKDPDKGMYAEIQNFINKQFNDGETLGAIVTNGIGANDQFMWSLVEMYNRNRPEGAPAWYHVITARDLVKLQHLKPETTLYIHISRSGSTWEGVEVADRALQQGFDKMIVLANSGKLKAIADKVNKEHPDRALQIGMQPDIGGRNMHRKTPIYYTVQTVIGMFFNKMDSYKFAALHDEFDQANDLGKADSLAVNLAKFLHGFMTVGGAEHIAFISNSKQAALIGSELSQYVMEGSNKEHVISWGDHDLTSEPAVVLRNLAVGAGRKTIGIALLDKASEKYKRELARVNELKNEMPLVVFTIDSEVEPGFAGVSMQGQAAFDILWTDFITALTTFLRVDANSNPNVKVVRGMTDKYAAQWKDIEARYKTDPIGTGQAKVVLSVGYPGTDQTAAVGTPEKQTVISLENVAEKARQTARLLAREGMLTNRDRLNFFGGTENLVDLMKAMRVNTFRSGLAKDYGWITETGLYPGRAHKGHEATLAHSSDPRKPLLADQSVDIFLNQRSLGDDSFFNTPFVDITGTGADARVNGATIHQTNDSMTFPNIQRTAQVSPTLLFEFQTLTPEVRVLLATFQEEFVAELIEIESQRAASAVAMGEKDSRSAAQGKAEEFTKGGIDLNSDLLDLQIKRDGNGVPLPLPVQPIETMRINGFVPVIINVTPVPSLLMLLGLDAGGSADKEGGRQDVSYNLSLGEPKARFEVEELQTV